MDQDDMMDLDSPADPPQPTDQTGQQQGQQNTQAAPQTKNEVVTAWLREPYFQLTEGDVSISITVGEFLNITSTASTLQDIPGYKDPFVDCWLDEVPLNMAMRLLLRHHDRKDIHLLDSVTAAQLAGVARGAVDVADYSELGARLNDNAVRWIVAPSNDGMYISGPVKASNDANGVQKSSGKRKQSELDDASTAGVTGDDAQPPSKKQKTQTGFRANTAEETKSEKKQGQEQGKGEKKNDIPDTSGEKKQTEFIPRGSHWALLVVDKALNRAWYLDGHLTMIPLGPGRHKMRISHMHMTGAAAGQILLGIEAIMQRAERSFEAKTLKYTPNDSNHNTYSGDAGAACGPWVFAMLEYIVTHPRFLVQQRGLEDTFRRRHWEQHVQEFAFHSLNTRRAMQRLIHGAAKESAPNGLPIKMNETVFDILATPEMAFDLVLDFWRRPSAAHQVPRKLTSARRHGDDGHDDDDDENGEGGSSGSLLALLREESKKQGTTPEDLLNTLIYLRKQRDDYEKLVGQFQQQFADMGLKSSGIQPRRPPLDPQQVEKAKLTDFVEITDTRTLKRWRDDGKLHRLFEDYAWPFDPTAKKGKSNEADWPSTARHSATKKAVFHRTYKGSFADQLIVDVGSAGKNKPSATSAGKTTMTNAERTAMEEALIKRWGKWALDEHAFTDAERQNGNMSFEDMRQRMDHVYIDLDIPDFETLTNQQVDQWIENIPNRARNVLQDKKGRTLYEKARGVLYRLFVGEFDDWHNEEFDKRRQRWVSNDPAMKNGNYTDKKAALDFLKTHYGQDKDLPVLEDSPLHWPDRKYRNPPASKAQNKNANDSVLSKQRALKDLLVAGRNVESGDKVMPFWKKKNIVVKLDNQWYNIPQDALPQPVMESNNHLPSNIASVMKKQKLEELELDLVNAGQRLILGTPMELRIKSHLLFWGTFLRANDEDIQGVWSKDEAAFRKHSRKDLRVDEMRDILMKFYEPDLRRKIERYKVTQEPAEETELADWVFTGPAKTAWMKKNKVPDWIKMRPGNVESAGSRTMKRKEKGRKKDKEGDDQEDDQQGGQEDGQEDG